MQPVQAVVPAPAPAPAEDTLQLTLREVERRHVARVLEDCSQNRSETARRLGVSRHALYRLLRKHELE